MIKGFLKISIDGRGDMIINVNDISHVFTSVIPNTGIVQTNIVLTTLGTNSILKVNCELDVFEESLQKVTA